MKFDLIFSLISTNPSKVLLLTINLLIFSESARVSKQRHLPEKCKAGKVYTITKVQDLWDNHQDLYCIYYAAEEPFKVPVGPMLGDIFSIANSRLMNPMLRFLWKGKLVTKIECNGTAAYLGWNKMGPGPFAPSMVTVGRVQEKLPSIESMYLDNKTSILLDYTRDIAEACPDYELFMDKNPEVLKIKTSPFRKNFFPFDQVVDSMRPVGKQKDGGIIYLGIAFGRDPYRYDLRASPCAFFSVVNYDEKAVPGLKYRQSLQPLEHDIYYRHRNFFDLLVGLQPFDDILLSPIHSAKAAFRETLTLKNFISGVAASILAVPSGEAKILTDQILALAQNDNSSEDEASNWFLSTKYGTHSHYNEL